MMMSVSDQNYFNWDLNFSYWGHAWVEWEILKKSYRLFQNPEANRPRLAYQVKKNLKKQPPPEYQ